MLPSCSINIFSLKTVLKQSSTIKLFLPFNRKTGLLPFPPQLCAVTPVRAEAGGQPRPAAFAAGSAGSAVGIPGSQANLFIAFPLLKYSPQNSATALGRLVVFRARLGGEYIYSVLSDVVFRKREGAPGSTPVHLPRGEPFSAAGGGVPPMAAHEAAREGCPPLIAPRRYLLAPAARCVRVPPLGLGRPPTPAQGPAELAPSARCLPEPATLFARID